MKQYIILLLLSTVNVHSGALCDQVMNISFDNTKIINQEQ